MSVDLIIICGATGSGKSNLAIELAKKLDTEIISALRGFPTLAEWQGWKITRYVYKS